MAKTKISEYSSTANSNTDIASINIDEGCAPSGINNAIRALMAQLKDFQTGAAGDPVTVGDVLTVKGASINDTNGNELFKLTATASAVNELTVANAATGGSPTISATGGDTNVGINLTPKGTGGVVFPAGAVATPAITTSGDLNTGVYFPAADTVGITTGGTERVRVDSSGNVGIGTSSPSFAFGKGLMVNNAGSATLRLNNSTDSVNAEISSYTSGLLCYTLTSHPILFGIGGSEKVRIDTSGNLLVGTTSGTYKVDVTDNSTGTQMRLSSSSGNGCSMNFTSTSTNGRTYRIGSNFSSGAGEFAFYDATAAAERARIDSSGNLLVGTTSFVGGAGQAALTSRKDTSGWFAAAFQGWYGVGINAIAGSGSLMYFYYNGGSSPVGSIATGGTTTSYNTSSDYRLKENIAPMTGALAKVAALKPCTYTWKVDGSSGEGFIAHELQEVVPDAVTGEKDGVETYIDEDGNEQTRPKYQGIDTSFLVATLTAAIQEQQAIITQLQADVAALKGQA